MEMEADIETEYINLLKTLIFRLISSGYFPVKIVKNPETSQLRLILSPFHKYVYSTFFLLLSFLILISFGLHINYIYTIHANLGRLRSGANVATILLSLVTIIFMRIRSLYRHSLGLQVWHSSILITEKAYKTFKTRVLCLPRSLKVERLLSYRVWGYLIMGIVEFCIIIFFVFYDPMINDKAQFEYGIGFVFYGLYELLLLFHQTYSTSVIAFVYLYAELMLTLEIALRALLFRLSDENGATGSLTNEMRREQRDYGFLYKGRGLKTLVASNSRSVLNCKLEKYLKFLDSLSETIEEFNCLASQYFSIEFLYQTHFILLKCFSILSLVVSGSDRFWIEVFKCGLPICISMMVLYSFTSVAEFLSCKLRMVVKLLQLVQNEGEGTIEKTNGWKVSSSASQNCVQFCANMVGLMVFDFYFRLVC